MNLDPPPRRIAVFRALQLGDLLVSVPALRALKHGLPGARLTLIGLPWAATFVARFAHLLDDFLEFPGHPALPERACDLARWPEFLRRAQAARFDMAVQLHGSGGTVNALLGLLGARATAGFHEPDGDGADQPGFLPWPAADHEIHKCLRLTRHLGLPPAGEHLEFPLHAADHAALHAALRVASDNVASDNSPGAGGGISRATGDGALPRPYAVVHAGAQLASRRWPAGRFAQVADWLATRGLRVVLTGTVGEAPLTRAVCAGLGASARERTLDLTGRTDLGALAALIDGARLVVCNDTGVSHLAAALGTPSVVVASGSDPGRWAPLDHGRHRVLAHWTDCRPCAHAACPFPGHPCAAGVPVAAMLAACEDLLATGDGRAAAPGTAPGPPLP